MDGEKITDMLTKGIIIIGVVVSIIIFVKSFTSDEKSNVVKDTNYKSSINNSVEIEYNVNHEPPLVTDTKENTSYNSNETTNVVKDINSEGSINNNVSGTNINNEQPQITDKKENR